MATYPINDGSNLTDSVNYLLSGPSGLGQSFQSFHSDKTAWLTGNYRIPFTNSEDTTGAAATMYVFPIPLSTSEWLDAFTFKFTFATPFVEAPFSLGNNVYVNGVTTPSDAVYDFTFSGTKVVTGSSITYPNLTPTTVTGSGSGAKVNITVNVGAGTVYNNSSVYFTVVQGGSGYAIGDTLKIAGNLIGAATPANDLTLTVADIINDYDGTYTPYGVIASTTTYVIVRTRSPYNNPGMGTGGEISLNAAEFDAVMSTDCNAFTTVVGPTQRVVLSAQLNNITDYIAIEDSTFDYVVQLNRYKQFNNNDPINPGLYWALDKTIAVRTFPANNVATTVSAVLTTTASGTKAVTTYPDTYTNITPLTATGSGTGLIVDIKIQASASTTYDSSTVVVTILEHGQNYAVGDTVLITGDLLGAATPANDLTLTIDSVGSVIATPQFTNECIITPIIDNPEPNLYWYILEVQYVLVSGNMLFTNAQLGFRTLTAEVLKE